MPGISQEPVKPGGRFIYEFNIHQEGTYFYHSHMAMQEMAGMLGAFIMHPEGALSPALRQGFPDPSAGIRGAAQQHRARTR